MNEVSRMVKNRLSAFIEYKGLTNASFEKKCGLSNGYIRNFKGNLGVKKLEDISYILQHAPSLAILSM